MNSDQTKMWDILNGPKEWIVTVNEDGTLDIPPDLIARMGWVEGDVLDVDVTETGTITLALDRNR